MTKPKRATAKELSYDELARALPKMNASDECPLCGKLGVHVHAPKEVVIYRNGIRFGLLLSDAARNLERSKKP